MNEILVGNAAERLPEIPDASMDCCVTSPPYWGLRDYGVDGQIGLERTPEEYVDRLVAVFREVRRVLRPDGTAWVNIGDCYASAGCGGATGESGLQGSTESQDQSKKR
jgi:DNA modification methylase